MGAGGGGGVLQKMEKVLQNVGSVLSCKKYKKIGWKV